MTLALGWFTTARGPGSRVLFEAVVGAIERGALDARIAVVCCNRAAGEHPITDAFLRRVEELQLPLVTHSSVAFRRAHGGERSRAGAPLPPWREAYDAELAAALAPYPFALGVLAGYMLIFGAAFVARHPLLNLHPALPSGPAGTWREVIRSLIRVRARDSGVMLHLAIPEVDAGPVASFCRYPLDGPALAPFWAALGPDPSALPDAAIEASGLFDAIREEGVRREAPLLVATLVAFADRRLHVAEGRLLDARGAPAAPADLTADVEALLRASG
ncbi:MAG: phosphoglycerate transporter [Chloroflexi bacterium]|nr:phosphoglycerate transporter [Chloroflexota bacterium]